MLGTYCGLPTTGSYGVGSPTNTRGTQNLQPLSTGDHSAETAMSWKVEVRETSKGQVQTMLSCLGELHAGWESRAGEACQPSLATGNGAG